MFSTEVKHKIARKVQEILRETRDPELGSEKINFLLHVDGAESWSWANIRNNGMPQVSVPPSLVRNTSVK